MKNEQSARAGDTVRIEGRVTLVQDDKVNVSVGNLELCLYRASVKVKTPVIVAGDTVLLHGMGTGHQYKVLAIHENSLWLVKNTGPSSTPITVDINDVSQRMQNNND